MDLLKSYKKSPDAQSVDDIVNRIKGEAAGLKNVETLQKIFNLIDLTTLNATDTNERVMNMVNKVNDFKNNFDQPNVAAICVYPPFVKLIKDNLTAEHVDIASVGAGFPSSQTFVEVKTLESKMCAENGADEVDIVISLGTFMSGDYQTVFDEIKAVKESLGETKLKVILESGSLATPELIWDASIISMEAGADFIKTSTGKTEPAATPEAMVVMCQAINAYMEKTGRKVGVKPAGGISVADEALVHFAIVKDILGEDWLNNTWFRIGASRLANNLLTDIAKLNGKNEEVAYF